MESEPQLMANRFATNALKFVLVGLFAGVLSGLFGIGGGTVIVPSLVLWMQFNQKMAAGTSVAAILPTAIVGTIVYAVAGNIDWVVAGALALGVIFGAQIGSLLLSKFPVALLQWLFIVFLLAVIVSLWIVVPARSDQVDVTVVTVPLLVVTGFATGVLSLLLGVGGGIIIVPVLMFFFGSNDLGAKGASLAMMIPGSISGTFGNWKKLNVDLRAAAFIGIAASLSVPIGALFAASLDPFWANAVFSVYLCVILIQLVFRRLRLRRTSE